MQKLKRLTALFLAALMVLSLIGVRPAEAATEKYTVTVKFTTGKGTVLLNGKKTTSVTVEAGKEVTISIKPQSGAFIMGPPGSPNEYTEVSTKTFGPDECTWTIIPKENVTFQVSISDPVRLTDLGSKTIDLRNDSVTYSGAVTCLPIFMSVYAAIETEMVAGDFLGGPENQEVLFMDLDGNGSRDVLITVVYDPSVSSPYEIPLKSIKFEKAEGSSGIDLAAVTLTGEAKSFVAAMAIGELGETEMEYYSSLVFAFSSVSLAKAAVTVKDQTYTGKALTPAPTVKLDGAVLKKGTDYSVTYKNNTNAGIATVTIKGKAPYTGTVSRTFKIKPASISKATVSGLSAKTYTGSAIKPAPVVKFGGKTLKSGTDYTVSYKNNTNAGTATVTIKGKGNFNGSVNKTFTIKPASIAKAKITGLKDQMYTGKAITQTPVVKLGTKTLKAGTDYTVKYAGNTNVGTATVTVTGKGNYTGSVKATFKITDPVEEFVARLYRVCLDREPEAQGHAWWVARLKAKQETGGTCAWGFFDSTEFKNHKYSNSAFLDHAYQAFFGRKADAAGKKYWLNLMDRGLSRKNVIMSGFAVSNEWKALCKTYGIKP